MNRQRLTKPYMLLVIAIGAVVSVYSAIHLPIERIDLRFLVLALLTISISSRLSVRIPRISGHISVSDTFIFLTMLIYGGEAAVLLAAAEALCSTLRFSKKAIYIKPLTIIFITAKITDIAGFYALVATTPIIAIVYFTYRTYLQNIDAMATAAKAEAAAEAKAEALAAQAEQARHHVEELNHYIAEQERIREQYSQIEKMSALGELASGVAHDFNNTLAGILGRAQLLLGKKDPAKIENGLEIIIKTAKDGAKTIKRIQDFARQRRDHDFQPVDMSQLLLDVGEITRPRWKDRAEAANVHISLDLQLHCSALIMGDESELREVLVNMVFNAVDAMPQGGTLTLATREVDSQVEISVSDTGVGMGEEVRSRIFNPFFTTKGKTGMGLGLAVSYG